MCTCNPIDIYTLIAFQLFVRAYTADGSSKSILVDESMTVAEVSDILVAKNHAHPSVHWSVIEHMPDLHMGKLTLLFFNYVRLIVLRGGGGIVTCHKLKI